MFCTGEAALYTLLIAVAKGGEVAEKATQKIDGWFAFISNFMEVVLKIAFSKPAALSVNE